MKAVRKKRKLNLRLNKLKINRDYSPENQRAPSAGLNGKFNQIKLFEVTPHLFMSGYHSAKNLDCLKKHQISHVVNLTSQHCPNLHSREIEYSSFVISDRANFDLLSILDRIITIVQEKIEQGHRVLIHCKMGVSRAPSIVLAFLIKKMKMTYEAAFENLQKINSKISPNLGFLIQLQQFEKLTLN